MFYNLYLRYQIWKTERLLVKLNRQIIRCSVLKFKYADVKGAEWFVQWMGNLNERNLAYEQKAKRFIESAKTILEVRETLAFAERTMR